MPVCAGALLVQAHFELITLPSNLLPTHVLSDFSDDADKQQVQGGHEEEEDGNSDSVELYHILIYIFTAVGCLMVVSTVVVVVAILVVRKRRRQLVDLELLTRTEKIASMKQNGYINPTYKFFEECNDS